MIKLGWASFSNTEFAQDIFIKFANQFYKQDDAGTILFELKKTLGVNQLDEIEKNKKVIIVNQFQNNLGKFLLFNKENTKRINSLANEHISSFLKKIFRLSGFKDMLIDVQHHKKLQKCLLREIHLLVCLINSNQFSDELMQIIEWYQYLKKHSSKLFVITASSDKKPVIEPTINEYKAIFGEYLSSFHLDLKNNQSNDLFQKLLDQIKIKATSKTSLR